MCPLLRKLGGIGEDGVGGIALIITTWLVTQGLFIILGVPLARVSIDHENKPAPSVHMVSGWDSQYAGRSLTASMVHLCSWA